MLLTILNLPHNIRYSDLRALVLEKCGIDEVILDSLTSEGNRTKKVTIGVAGDEEGAILIKQLNGYYLEEHQLKVIPKSKMQNSFNSNKPQSGSPDISHSASTGGNWYEGQNWAQAPNWGQGQSWNPAGAPYYSLQSGASTSAVPTIAPTPNVYGGQNSNQVPYHLINQPGYQPPSLLGVGQPYYYGDTTGPNNTPSSWSNNDRNQLPELVGYQTVLQNKSRDSYRDDSSNRDKDNSRWDKGRDNNRDKRGGGEDNPSRWDNNRNPEWDENHGSNLNSSSDWDNQKNDSRREQGRDNNRGSSWDNSRGSNWDNRGSTSDRNHDPNVDKRRENNHGPNIGNRGSNFDQRRSLNSANNRESNWDSRGSISDRNHDPNVDKRRSNFDNNRSLNTGNNRRPNWDNRGSDLGDKHGSSNRASRDSISDNRRGTNSANDRGPNSNRANRSSNSTNNRGLKLDNRETNSDNKRGPNSGNDRGPNSNRANRSSNPYNNRGLMLDNRETYSDNNRGLSRNNRDASDNNRATNLDKNRGSNRDTSRDSNRNTYRENQPARNQDSSIRRTEPNHSGPPSRNVNLPRAPSGKRFICEPDRPVSPPPINQGANWKSEQNWNDGNQMPPAKRPRFNEGNMSDIKPLMNSCPNIRQNAQPFVPSKESEIGTLGRMRRNQLASTLARDLMNLNFRYEVPDMDALYEKVKYSLKERINVCFGDNYNIPAKELMNAYRSKFNHSSHWTLMRNAVNSLGGNMYSKCPVMKKPPRTKKVKPQKAPQIGTCRVSGAYGNIKVDHRAKPPGYVPRPIPPKIEVPKQDNTPLSKLPGRIPKNPKGDFRLGKQLKRENNVNMLKDTEYVSELVGKLKPALSKAVDQEVNILCNKVLHDINVDEPNMNAEKRKFQQYMRRVPEFLKQIITVHLGRRLQGDQSLLLRVIPNPSLRRPLLEKFLLRYNISSLKRSKKYPYYIATCTSTKDFDELCALKKCVISGSVVNFKPFHVIGGPGLINAKMLRVTAKQRFEDLMNAQINHSDCILKVYDDLPDLYKNVDPKTEEQNLCKEMKELYEEINTETDKHENDEKLLETDTYDVDDDDDIIETTDALNTGPVEISDVENETEVMDENEDEVQFVEDRQGDLPIDESQVADDKISEKHDEISDKRDGISEKRDEISEKTDEISGKTHEISEKRDEISEKTDEISKKSDEISKKSDVITKKPDEIPKKPAVITDLDDVNDDEVNEEDLEDW